MAPTQAGFLIFIRQVMGIPTAALADNAPIIGWVFNFALAYVNQDFPLAGGAPSGQWSIWADAVYNLAGDRLVNFAQDVPPSTFFADLRTALKLDNFKAGVISSASDVTTSETLLVPEAFKNLTLLDLQQLNTPWGRQYLGLAQSYGSLWGLS